MSERVPPEGRPPRGDALGAAESVGVPVRGRWGVLAGLSVVTFLLLADDTAISVTLPSIQRDLGVDLGVIEWIVNAYALAIAAFTLLAGRLVDRYGAPRLFRGGLALFVVGSLVGGLVQSAPGLLTARSVQGIGAALVAPAALAAIADAFSPRERGTALGVWAGVSASALGLGPLFGAIVADGFGWQWIFLVNVPLGVVAWLVAWAMLPRSQPPATQVGMDPGGVILSAIVLVGLVLVAQSTGGGWGAPPALALVAVTVAATAVFIAHERRVRHPLVDLALFRDRIFTGASLVTLLSTAVMCSLFFFLALFLQTVRGLSSLQAAADLLPLTITIVAVAPIAGRLADRWGGAPLISGGMLTLAVGLFGLRTFGLGADGVGFAIWLAAIGLGIGMARTPTTAAALARKSSGYGMAAGVFNSVQATGLALGITVMSVILTSAVPNAAFDRGVDTSHHTTFLAGFSVALLVNAAIAGIAAVVAAILMGTRRGIRPDR